MPKRIPVEEKRVPLNCLVLPATLEYLRAAEGSQGHAVDRAVAALRMQEAQGRVMAETGDPWKAVAVNSIADGLVNQGRGNQNPDESFSQVVTKEIKRQAQSWKRGPRPKGDPKR